MTSLPGINLIFHSIRPGGGMERHVLDLIAYVAGRGIAMRVITRNLSWPGEPPRNVEFLVLRDCTPFSRLNTLFFEQNAHDRCREGWPSIAVSRAPGPEMAIVGGTHLGHLIDRGKHHPGFLNRRTIARERALYEQAKIIVAHSSRVKEEIANHYGIAGEKIVALYPPVDTAMFSVAARAGRDATRQTLGVAPDEMLLLFPSNNHVLKGADLILQALRDFEPRIRLAVAGKTPLEAPNVLNLGFRQDMPALYAAADAVILASFYEAFGLVGPEAILCGTPVLFADTVGAGEVLSDTACLRFERNVPALRAALRQAFERFEAGSLALAEPEKHIHYPHSLPQHFDAVLDMLAGTINA